MVDFFTPCNQINMPIRFHQAGRESGGVPPVMEFIPSRQMQRTGLLLDRGRITLGFASHGDELPYQGWVFSYNAADLKRIGVWSSIGGGPVTHFGKVK